MTVILERLTGAFALNCELFFLTLLFSLPLGLVVAFGSMSRCAPLRGVVKTFVWVIRGTPLMPQIIVIYLGPGLLGMTNPWPSGSSGRLVAAVVAFAINYACYFSEIYRGGIEAVPKGQTEACLLYTSSINMDYRSLFLHFECGALLLYNSQVIALRDDVLRTLPERCV